MQAVSTVARVIETRWLTPSVVSVKFDPVKKFQFEPGQFLSLWIPNPQGPNGFIKRAYTFASPWEMTREHGYEFCVKIKPQGVAGQYVPTLKVGDDIRISGPYGDFVYEIPEQGRIPCFISTSTGLSPFRAMMLSPAFREETASAEEAVCLFGVRDEKEVIYPDLFSSGPAKSTIAISRASEGWNGFRGRVTDYLRTLPPDWFWHSAEFYLCGNSPMIEEVRRILIGGHGVQPRAIHQESFSE